jgi:DNA topoisomerase-1
MRSGRGFRYVDAAGRAVRDRATLDRIRRLAIPPAWTGVWICPSALGHLQATGRDAKRRKQYRYHARWRVVRDGAKYGRVAAFARRLPALRTRVAHDLRTRGLGKRRVVAAVVGLLEATLIRVGNEEYARHNRSFGLTTLRDRHASVSGSHLRFRFRGKSGRVHEVHILDRRLVTVVRRCQELPGQALFQYLDERGRRRTVGSADVNRYLRHATGADFTAKDFRTWAGTVLAASELCGLGAPSGGAQARRNVSKAVRGVAVRLGNTPAICRRSYIHPAIVDAYSHGALQASQRGREGSGRGGTGLTPREAWVLTLISPRSRPTRSALAPQRRAKVG